jgi:hypothetical protein
MQYKTGRFPYFSATAVALNHASAVTLTERKEDR